MITKKPLFWWAMHRYRGLQILLFLLILVTIFFRVFPLEMQKRIVNSAIAFKKTDILLIYCGLYLGAVILAGVLKYLINVLQGYIGQRLLLEIRTQLYDHILKLPLSFYRRTPPGMVIASLTSELSVVGDVMGGAIAVPVINFLTLAAFAAYLAWLNPFMALLSFAFYPAEILIVPLLQRKFNRLNQHRIGVIRKMSNVVGEAVSGMHEIHGHASYKIEREKLAQPARDTFGVRIRMNSVKFLIKFVNNFFQGLGPFILFLIGGWLAIEGRFDLGALVAFLSAYEKLYDPWKELMDYYQDLQDARVRYRQIMGYFDEKPEFEVFPEEEARLPVALEGGIDVRDLSYAADGQIRILEQISFAVEAGGQMAVVGPSGSGKSTVAMVLGQLYAYHEGRVLYDGVDLKTLSKLDVSHNIGYVPQEPFIFDGTILDNVLYAWKSLSDGASAGGREQPPREEINRIVEDVGLHDDILGIGLNTVLQPEAHSELAGELVRLRGIFYDRWGKSFSDRIDFFDAASFQSQAAVWENIVFGYAGQEAYQPDRLPANLFFREFLEDSRLLAPLLRFGEQIARQTVLLLKELQGDAFFFESSPISMEEFGTYSSIIEALDRHGRAARPAGASEALLRLALRFVPALHKMVALPAGLEKRILDARTGFQERASAEVPGAFTFYRPSEYLYSQNIMGNVLFGHVKTGRPKSAGLAREKVVQLLAEEGLTGQVLEIGLGFQVGSKGDRLSGGQKQKIAIARTLLKKPRIMILDEATSSLDNTSQVRIQELLRSALKGKCTLISVVHRLETVRDFDRIAVMKAGRIVEMGRYEELMTRKGLFYELATGA
jgi:ABC-type multidrug transport system fused ATPase/permease subunit